jgi:hypothetical protein
MTEADARALLHLWALALVTGAAILAAVSFDTSGWVAWSARFIAVCLMLASVLLLVTP